MTHDYDSWWHVGVASTAKKPAIRKMYDKMEENLEKAKKY
jgi:3D-(3,5/4)-trihydroxycyclohexane-1,2-dione acylhydrolase (decyclizing)